MTNQGLDIGQNFIINNEWRLYKKIGAGSFGEIYLAINDKTKVEAAAKMEAVKGAGQGQLDLEYKLLQTLNANNAIGITKVYWYGKDTVQNLYTAMIMELLGPSLEDLFAYCKCKYSLKTTLMLADQMLKRIEFMHTKCLIHRDIKPDNFLMGNGINFNTVYVIDFGLSKQFMDPRTKKHIPFRELKNLTGTARYCSIHAHEGYEHSRRDDLEALGYVFLYFIKGSLPWQGLQGDSKRDKFKKIHQTKASITPSVLCEGLPGEFESYITYCRRLKFEEEPDYNYLRGLIWTLMEKESITYDFQYDWIVNRS